MKTTCRLMAFATIALLTANIYASPWIGTAKSRPIQSKSIKEESRFIFPLFVNNYSNMDLDIWLLDENGKKADNVTFWGGSSSTMIKRGTPGVLDVGFYWNIDSLTEHNEVNLLLKAAQHNHRNAGGVSIFLLSLT